MTLIKITSILLLISASLNTSYGQNQFNRQAFNLVGKVALLHEYTYYADEKFGEVTKGNLKSESTYIFNENGKLIEERFTDENSRKEIRTYQYNENGHLIEANDSQYRTIYKCASNGNPIEAAVYHLDGSLKSKTYYKYDANNREIEARTNSSGTVSKSTCKYDLKGNMIQYELYLGDSKLATATSKYDTKGNPIENIIDSRVKLKQVFKYTYDSTGNFITKTIFKASSFNSINYELEAENIVERKIEFELSAEEKEKLRIEEQRKNEVIEQERLRLEQEAIAREKERKDRIELLSFLEQRKKTYYDLNVLSPTDFSNVANDSHILLCEKIKSMAFDELSIGGVLVLTSDTLNVVSVNTTKLTSTNSAVLNAVVTPTLSLTLPGQKIRNYKVNIKASVPIDIKFTKVNVSFKLKKSNEIVYSGNEPSDRIKQLIRKSYQFDSNANNAGTYTVEYFTGSANKRDYEDVKTLNYK